MKENRIIPLAVIFFICELTVFFSPPAQAQGPIDEIDVKGTLYTKLGDRSSCILHPLEVVNTGSKAVEFNRIHIQFKRQKTIRGDVIAQDIYFQGEQRISRQYMEGMAPEELKFPDDVKPSRESVGPGMGFAYWDVQIFGCEGYAFPNPTTMEVTLYLNKIKVSRTHFVILPKRSTLTIPPNVKIEGITGGPGYQLEFKKR